MKIPKKLVSVFLSLLVMASCTDKTDKANAPVVDPTDANTVASQLSIKNATVVQGTPPSPSSSSSAPVIDSYADEKAFSAQGFTLVVSADITSGTAAGVYLVVKGSNSYYNISTLNNRSGRIGRKTTRTALVRSARTQETQGGDDVEIAIKLPENIKPGTFCVAYCVYDAQNLVSNIIERCVEVKQLGSSDPQIAGTWTGTKYEVTEDGILTGYPFGQETCIQETGFCSTSITYQECNKPTKFVLNLATNGAFTYEFEETEKYATQICPLLYKTENYTESGTGGWSYDATTKKYVMIINADDAADEEAFPVEFTVSKLTSSEFVFGLEESGFKATYYMKK